MPSFPYVKSPMNSQIAKVGLVEYGTKAILGGENCWVSLYQVSGSGVITATGDQGFVSPWLRVCTKGLTFVAVISSAPVVNGAS